MPIGGNVCLHRHWSRNTPESESIAVKKQSLVQAGGAITVAFSFLVGCPLQETNTES